MSKKNFKAATAQDSKTPKQDTKHAFATSNISKDNTPTGKVKTIKDKEQIKKEREENFKNFRINAFKRRAKRLNLSNEDTEAKLKELIEQMNAPHDYDIVVTFCHDDNGLVKEALANNKLTYKIMSLSHRKQDYSYFFTVGNQEVLDTLRKVMPSSAKIMPHVKKKEPVLPVSPPKCRGPKKYTKAQKRAMAAEAKKARKKAKLKYFADRSEHAKTRKEAVNKKKRTEANHKILFQKRCEKASKKRQKTQGGTTVQLKAKKGSTALKKASTSLKQAA